MAKPVALITGDWHQHDWKQFNSGDTRLYENMGLIGKLFIKAEELNVPILFTGDMWHTPKEISVKTLAFYLSEYRTAVDNIDFNLFGISGNHDIYNTSKPGGKIYSSFNMVCRVFPSHFENIAYRAWVMNNQKLVVCGIPYLDYNIGFDKVVKKLSDEVDKIDNDYQKILLVHTDLHGAKDPSGREVGTTQNIPRNMGKFFKSFDKVFAGHIHKYDPLFRDKVYMVGAPNQQRKSDSGCRMGYLLLYDDGTVEQVETDYPEFKYYKEGDDISENHYWTKIEESKVKKKKKKINFSPTKNRSSLAKAYAKSQGVKSKKKITELIDVLNKADD